MRYIKEYNTNKFYKQVGEQEFLNQDSLNDNRIEVGEFKISTISDHDKKEVYRLLHNDNFHRQWFKYINVSIHDFADWRFMVKKPDDIKNKSLHIIIKPEVDINSKEWIHLGDVQFYIESFLIEDEYYYTRIDSQRPPMVRIDNGALKTRYDSPSTKYFKCDQMEGLIDCLKEEIPNWYPGLKKSKYIKDLKTVMNNPANESNSYDSKLDDDIHNLVTKILKMPEGIDKDEAKMTVVGLINKRKELRKQGIVPAFTTAPVRYKRKRKRTRDDLAGETPIFEDFEMEDLEDYLLEFFDKYNIVKTGKMMEMDDDYNYNNYYIDTLTYNGGEEINKIVIEIHTNNYIEICKEFTRIKPNIERRLGEKLNHKFPQWPAGSTVKIIEIF